MRVLFCDVLAELTIGKYFSCKLNRSFVSRLKVIVDVRRGECILKRIIHEAGEINRCRAECSLAGGTELIAYSNKLMFFVESEVFECFFVSAQCDKSSTKVLLVSPYCGRPVLSFDSAQSFLLISRVLDIRADGAVE